LLPGFVDLHTHLDKAYTVARTGASTSGLDEAVRLSMADAPNRTHEDLVARMERGIAAAWAQGSFALRSHIDTFDLPAENRGWAAFAEVAARWQGRMALQAVGLMALARVEQDDFDLRCAQLAERGGLMGAFIDQGTATPERIATLLAGAARHGLDLDLHVDENLDPAANGLELLAEAVIETGFAGKVTAGHCVALGQREAGGRDALIARVAEAGINVVALPLANSYLQDRAPGRTPIRRGIAPVQELRAAGVQVAFASDNVRDAFYPFGAFDMLEVQRQATYLAQLEGAPGEWIAASGAIPAAIMGVEAGRITAGGAANGILFDARDWADLFSGTAVTRQVLRAQGTPAAARVLERENV